MARKFQMGIAAMAHTQSLSFLPRNAHSVPFVELQQSLPSGAAVVSPFTGELMRFILNFRSADGSETDIEMALLEALANAVIHGIYLMKTLMDEVSFEEGGSVVRMRKNSNASSAQRSDPSHR
jgi:anti-sigma regulatory factor (Ser/Thr protein kinase)